jgi:hypothetical protein
MAMLPFEGGKHPAPFLGSPIIGIREGRHHDETSGCSDQPLFFAVRFAKVFPLLDKAQRS